MRESLPLAVSPAPLQDKYTKAYKEKNGEDTCILKEQYGKSVRRINVRKLQESVKKGRREEQPRKKNQKLERT